MSEMYLYFLQSNKSFRVDGTKKIVAGRSILRDLKLARYFEREDIAGDIGLISGQHFEVYKIGDEFYIMDLRSKNGTELNRKLLAANHSQKLNDGDVIRLARCDDFIIKVKMDSGTTAVIQPESGLYFDGSLLFTVDGKPVTKLKAGQEFDLLTYLYSNVGQICSYEEIYNAVWKLQGTDAQAITSVVKKIRKKLDNVSKGAGKRHIKTIQGEGYMLHN